MVSIRTHFAPRRGGIVVIAWMLVLGAARASPSTPRDRGGWMTVRPPYAGRRCSQRIVEKLVQSAEKARSRGLPAATAAELKRVPFVGGVNTVDTVSYLPGRGVGMGALLEGIMPLGGDLAIDSVPAQGTTLRMTFPQSAAQSLPAMSAAA